MRHNPDFASEDLRLVRDLVRTNPWALLVTASGGIANASHYPIVIDEDREDLTVLTHLGKPDDRILRIADAELLVVVQGNHGYVSPSWYEVDEGNVPTWNFTVAHLRGVPEILGEDENLMVLAALVDRFESPLPTPARLDLGRAAGVARGTVGLWIPVDSFQFKRKLSQNKPVEVRRRVVAALRRPGVYQHQALADEMEREIEASPADGRR